MDDRLSPIGKPKTRGSVAIFCSLFRHSCIPIACFWLECLALHLILVFVKEPSIPIKSIPISSSIASRSLSAHATLVESLVFSKAGCVASSNNYPNIENDLLLAIINVGYLPNDSINFIERMNANSNSIMKTPSRSLPVYSIKEKVAFMEVIEADRF